MSEILAISIGERDLYVGEKNLGKRPLFTNKFKSKPTHIASKVKY